MPKKYQTFNVFYPFYLREHADIICRRLHFVGSTLVLVLLLGVLLTGSLWLLIAVPFAGYGFAWVGHFFFEKNKTENL